MTSDQFAKSANCSDLITRLEQAEAGSRELDAEIADYLKWWPAEYRRIDHWGRDRRWGKNNGFLTNYVDCPKFTTSLDAIVALIGEKLPGQYWAVTEHPDGFVATVGGPFHSQVKGVTMTTAPLALCIALLRALNQGGEHG